MVPEIGIGGRAGLDYAEFLRKKSAAQRQAARMLARHRIRQAGGDPDTAKGRERERLIEAGRRIIAKAKGQKQAHVKRLHSQRLRSAMPLWANREAMQAIYAEAQRLTAETGEPHEVDHILPLLGENVSGLHVEYNLRVVHRTVNRRKSNRVLGSALPAYPYA